VNGWQSVLDLLSGGPGAFVYHLMVLLALLATAGIAFIEYRRARNPDQQRIAWAFLVLFLVRALLLMTSPAQADSLTGGVSLVNLSLPVLAGALEVVSLAVMWWAFLTPLVGRRGGRLFLFGTLGLAAVVVAVFIPLWSRALRQGTTAGYSASWQYSAWTAWVTLIALSAALVLFLGRRRVEYDLPTISFAMLAGGGGLVLFGQIGAGRVVSLIAYSLLVVAVYRTALQDLYAYRRELETLSEESLRQTRELLFLLEVGRAVGESLELDAMLHNVAASVANALDADRSAVFLAGEEEESLWLAAQYVPLQRAGTRHEAQPVSLSDQPLLEHVLRRRKQMLVSPQSSPSRLRPLYDLLGSHEEGPLIVQPLLLKQRVLGVLVVGNDRSKRPFDAGEARLCDAAAPQIAAAIENARLYSRVEQQAARLTAALQAQQEEASRREAILESTAEGIIVTDAGGQVALMNAAAERVLGVERSQVLGHPLQPLLEAVAIDREVNLERLQQAALPVHLTFELQGRQVEVSAAPVRAADGTFLGMVAVLRDVTREVQAERAKREFIAVISHELRTPLTAILGYAEVLYAGTAGDLNPTQSRFVTTIHDNARRLVSLANNLIALSEGDRGRLELQYAPTDLAFIIGDVARGFAARMEAAQLECTVEVERDLPLIEADPERIRQILVNLVSNAMKYTFPGGRVTIGAGAMPVAEGGEPEYCRLWVSDTGVGIAPDKQQVIWERFSRGDGPVREEGSGLGLGLTIVKSLAEAHGGRVWVESAPGQGSTFTVLLPVRRPAPSLLEGEPAYPALA